MSTKVQDCNVRIVGNTQRVHVASANLCPIFCKKNNVIIFSKGTSEMS